jgi:excinuclease UvrABC helicase subunit UvrB
MKSSGLIILLSIILSFGLIVSGTYLVIDNMVHPQGNLFEGIVLSSLGIIVMLLLVIASSLGTAIQTFTNVFTQQVEMQQTMTEYMSKSMSQRPRSIGDILGSMGMDNIKESSISITNLDTGETSTRPISGEDSLGKINDIIPNALNKKSGHPKELKDMNRQQLEKELAKAVKKDDFEKANEIKELLNKLDDEKNSPDL